MKSQGQREKHCIFHFYREPKCSVLQEEVLKERVEDNLEREVCRKLSVKETPACEDPEVLGQERLEHLKTKACSRNC